MAYILGLFLIVVLVLVGFGGTLPFDFGQNSITGSIGDILNNFKKRTYDFVFPLSENEILVDNLNSNYNLLDKFFDKSAKDILNSKDIPADKKEEFKKALEVFNKTKDQIKVLGNQAVKKEPLIESLIKKTLGLEPSNQEVNTNTGIEPTYIPASCRLECAED